MTTPTPTAEATSVFKKIEKYVATEWQRVVAYVVTEGASLLTLAHVQATTFEHQITVAGAAAIAAAINTARANHLIP